MAIAKQTKIAFKQAMLKVTHFIDDGSGAVSAQPALDIAALYADTADTSVVVRLTTEITDRGTADTSLTTRVSQEESGRLSGDASIMVIHDSEEASLTLRLSNEEDASAAADGSLTTRVSLEESLRDSGDVSIMVIHDAEEASLTTRVSDEEDNRVSGDSSLQVRVVALETATVSGIQWKASVANQAAAVAAVNADLTSATGDAYFVTAEKDQYVYMTGLGVGNYDYNGWPNVDKGFVIIADLAEITGLVSVETSDRVSADLSIMVIHDAEEASLTIRIGDEETARGAADGSLTTRVSSEESNRVAGDLSLSNRATIEDDFRISADLSIMVIHDAEEASLTTRVSDEESNRVAGDLSLSNRATIEDDFRISADASIVLVHNDDEISANLRMDAADTLVAKNEMRVPVYGGPATADEDEFSIANLGTDLGGVNANYFYGKLRVFRNGMLQTVAGAMVADDTALTAFNFATSPGDYAVAPSGKVRFDTLLEGGVENFVVMWG